ncbi:hypothetical protein PT974_04204 [Cladobotryum mycophilum]|uniref:Uncharacterized protein n=1 Tax=Cladobotryum mycophilum TaxID=491253 RepID=A0ABR0SUF2_9HYPO
MAYNGTRNAFYAPRTTNTPEQTLIPVYNTSLAVPIRDLPLDIIIQSLDDANLHQYSLESLEIIPSGRLHMPFLIKCHDGSHYVLTLSPPAGVRLLRHERSSINSEATVLQWLSSLSIKRRTNLSAIMSHEPETSICINGVENGLNLQSLVGTLHDYLPKLIRHGSIDTGGNTLYNISTPSVGIAISNLPTPLCSAERESVDFQTGQLLRRVSLYCSPNHVFGMAAHALPQLVTRTDPSHRRNKSIEKSKSDLRSDSWSAAFHILLESALRDAEDLLLMISYDRIRYQFSRFRRFLDAVTRPSFVPIDIGDDTNTLVQRIGTNQGMCFGENDGQIYNKRPISSIAQAQINVTGLRDWSHCIFGDPLIASSFSTNPSPAFIRGFHTPLVQAERGMADYTSTPVEDQGCAHVRLLLYECFHSVVAIVKETYRWDHGSHTRELAGRKKLLDALARLDNLDNDGNLKHERPSLDIASAKRFKPEAY